VKTLLSLAVHSAWNRRFVLSLVALSIALSTFLLLGIERIRADVRENFSQSVSGTDLIVGPRTGGVQLLLYSVFRIGNATNNIRWSSVQTIAQHKAVAWMVPISLGDSHRGFSVVGTSIAYFEHFRYGERQALNFEQGKPFSSVFDAVLGTEVAEQLGYKVGDRIVLSHGDGQMLANDHADKPFTVVGILRRTGTPVDRSVHISLEGMEAIHLDWVAGTPMRGMSLAADQVDRYDLTPKKVTAVLIGLKNRASVFSVQRSIAEFETEPLMAILPGVALDELWDVVGIGERALLATSVLVSLVSLVGLVAVIVAGLEQRRRELAILRALGAGPRQILCLLVLEGMLVTLSGWVIGVIFCALIIAAFGDWSSVHLGIAMHLRAPAMNEWILSGCILASGLISSCVPGWRAYQISLVDGLTPRI
jgi:putative ABC transport system permease protein